MELKWNLKNGTLGSPACSAQGTVDLLALKLFRFTALKVWDVHIPFRGSPLLSLTKIVRSKSRKIGSRRAVNVMDWEWLTAKYGTFPSDNNLTGKKSAGIRGLSWFWRVPHVLWLVPHLDKSVPFVLNLFIIVLLTTLIFWFKLSL